MSDRAAVAWLGRKLAWGFAEGQYSAWGALGPMAVIDRLVDPAGNNIAARPPRFDGLEALDEEPGKQAQAGTAQWIEAAVTSERPLETFMEFFWSGFFSVSARVVRPQKSMFWHMDKLAEHALGNFRTLMQVIAIDASMLDFLDGGRNTKNRPNENFARELLELYTVGVGNFTEQDVEAASRTTTGWKLRRLTGEVEFVPDAHDDTPRSLLGTAGVRNVETTIDACLAHPSTAPRIVGKLATAILGPGYEAGPTEALAKEFAETWEIRPVVRGLLQLGVEGNRQKAVVEPLAWYCAARQLPVNPPDPTLLWDYFVNSGQLVMHPPNVGGFPGKDAYLSTAATLARLNIAHHLVRPPADPEVAPQLEALTTDLDALAERLGLPNGFLDGSRAAISDLEPGADRLAAVLVSPDMLVV